MRAWFTALYLVASSSKGISSVKLAEHLGIGQKTAWFLGQRIHSMMEDKDGLLKGIVEVDETYLGGKKRKKGQASKRDPQTEWLADLPAHRPRCGRRRDVPAGHLLSLQGGLARTNYGRSRPAVSR